MSQVFTCECGRKTTEPFVIRGVKMCVICAEDEAPEIVDRRAKDNYRRYNDKHMDVDRSRYGRSF